MPRPLCPPPLQVRAAMWLTLNTSNLGQYMHQNDSRTAPGRSPASLLGPCNANCSADYWSKHGRSNGVGPSCGVPGCTAAA